ncbi:RNA-binding motif, single-stranded-interacting protein 2-like isoform X2 [Halichondria panicea]|uniref:RNA-binding motif, single-stranded-interacting protein 2-like isoform X2 n=1 Tax=Halichondria panicea TaxID=6063 RepID=UPI00312B801B
MEPVSEQSGLQTPTPENTVVNVGAEGADIGLGVSGTVPHQESSVPTELEEDGATRVISLTAPASAEEKGPTSDTMMSMLPPSQPALAPQVITGSLPLISNHGGPAKSFKHTPSHSGRPLSASSHNPRSPGDTSSPRPPNNVYYRYIPVHIAPNPTSQPVYYQQQQAATAPPMTRPHHQQPGMNGSETLSSTNLYIRGLSRVCSDEDLLQLCKGFGRIISTKSILDKNTSLCKGYGFVDFESPGDAMRACQSLQTQGIIVQFAKVPQQDQDPTNLYMSNLPPDFEEPMIDNLLSPYGKIVSTRILRDSTMNSRGVGFARMETKESCDKVIEMLNGVMLPGSKEPLMIKFADSSNKKKQSQNRWRDVQQQQQYVYEPAQVISQPGLVGSRGLVPTGVLAAAPYVQSPPQAMQSYQVPVSNISGGWSPAATYFVHPSGSSEAGVHAMNAGMGGLQIASTTGYVPSNQYHYAANQAGAATYAQPTYAAQPTPGSWTIANAPYVQQDHTGATAVVDQSGNFGDKHTVQVIEGSPHPEEKNGHHYYPASTWSGK